ncbi:tRNA pseudouridine(13) synthase TruD [Candidatus Marsarchaeota archaeon]|nr:tRNA pseudouridine(13) synthase TruD [Candidatus Marsarchaeota archaeon]
MHRLSKQRRQAAALKQSPEDFVVEEITESGQILEVGRAYDAESAGMSASDDGKFTTFVLQKRDWNTTQALLRIAKARGRGRKSIGFAGTKDRTSISTQLCSVYGITPDELASVRIKDISINGAWKSKSGIKLGDLKGNRFTVTARGASDLESVSGIDKELGGFFPNYFGEQRFGFRNNNVEIGIAIMKGDFRSAVMSFLTDANNETNAEAVEARRKLSETQDFEKGLNYFPKYLKYERTVLGHLSTHSTDFAGALRKLPRQLSLMFVHSVESDMFNKVVEARIRDGTIMPSEGDIACGADAAGWPDLNNVYTVGARKQSGFLVGNIIGYNTQKLDRYEREVLDERGIEPEAFKLKGMPELSCKGSTRLLFAPYIGFRAVVKDESIVLGFSLPAGSYATVLLDEFIEGHSEQT